MAVLLLRLSSLAVFVHEVAHHHDRSRRTARGRWRQDREGPDECYAEGMEHRFVESVVAPYLRETYPRPTGRLRRWLREHAGVDVPLTMLWGDARRSERDGGWRWPAIFSTRRAFEDLFADAAKGLDRSRLRLDLAEDLAMCREHDLALRVVRTVPARDPRSPEAAGLRAWILVDAGRLDEALEAAQAALRLDSDDTNALGAAADAFKHRRDWPALDRTTGRLLDLLGADAPLRFMKMHAEAGLARGDLAAVRRALSLLEPAAALYPSRRDWRRIAARLRARLDRRERG
jgi:tetratricopeptide (TPR) repeat protein